MRGCHHRESDRANAYGRRKCNRQRCHDPGHPHDAEGRWCWPIHWPSRQDRPRFMIDFATPRGSCLFAHRAHEWRAHQRQRSRRSGRSGASVGSGGGTSVRFDLRQPISRAKWRISCNAAWTARVITSCNPVPEPLRSGRYAGRTWIVAASRQAGCAHQHRYHGFGVRYALELILQQDILNDVERRK